MRGIDEEEEEQGGEARKQEQRGPAAGAADSALLNGCLVIPFLHVDPDGRWMRTGRHTRVHA